MIGMFSKNQMNSSLFGNTDRLIVNVHTIEHHGQAIQVRGLVIAPDSMETAVATSVDQHYFERFALPAAAAFVAGLGQAIALSGSTMQFLPYGGYATTYRNLDFRQQAGIAAGRGGGAGRANFANANAKDLDGVSRGERRRRGRVFAKRRGADVRRDVLASRPQHEIIRAAHCVIRAGACKSFDLPVTGGNDERRCC